MKERLFKVDAFGRRCNLVAILWFWLTIFGVVYCGFEYILPAIYGAENTWMISVNKCICWIILIEMVINWAFMKFVTSPFHAKQHQDYLKAHQNEVQNGGFEIDMNELKRGGENGRDYSISKKSLYSSVSDPKLLNGTLYVVDADEAKTSLRHDGKHDANSNNVTGEISSRKLVFPYWSWKPCVICQTPRPPRAHHCPICGTCVLKRDHHCFFTGSCVGLRNQRYFVIFTFWGSLGTIFCLINSLAYLVLVHVPENTWWDTIWPILVVRCYLGYVTLLDVLYLTLFYSISWFCLTAVAFFREQILCIQRGITSFEQDNGIKITNVYSKESNLRGVFGKHWYLNFIVPLHFVFPQLDNGVSWDSIKPC